jgi:hypothetical protein
LKGLKGFKAKGWMVILSKRANLYYLILSDNNDKLLWFSPVGYSSTLEAEADVNRITSCLMETYCGTTELNYLRRYYNHFN